jgi:hypothetical protein
MFIDMGLILAAPGYSQTREFEAAGPIPAVVGVADGDRRPQHH